MTSRTRRCRWVSPSPLSPRSGKVRTDAGSAGLGAAAGAPVRLPDVRRDELPPPRTPLPDVPVVPATSPPRRLCRHSPRVLRPPEEPGPVRPSTGPRPAPAPPAPRGDGGRVLVTDGSASEPVLQTCVRKRREVSGRPCRRDAVDIAQTFDRTVVRSRVGAMRRRGHGEGAAGRGGGRRGG